MIANGQLIRARRLERGLGLNELARKIPMDSGNLSLLERGKRGAHMATLRRIAAELDLRMVDVLPELADMLAETEVSRVG